MLILEVIFVVVMLLWFLAVVPGGPGAIYPTARGWLAWIAVLCLGLALFAGRAIGGL